MRRLSTSLWIKSIFQKTAEKIKIEYKQNLIDKKSTVLFENKLLGKNEFFGRDKYLNSVIVTSEQNLKGKIKEVNITNGNQGSLFGEIDRKLDTENFAA